MQFYSHLADSIFWVSLILLILPTLYTAGCFLIFTLHRSGQLFPRSGALSPQVSQRNLGAMHLHFQQSPQPSAARCFHNSMHIILYKFFLLLFVKFLPFFSSIILFGVQFSIENESKERRVTECTKSYIYTKRQKIIPSKTPRPDSSSRSRLPEESPSGGRRFLPLRS